MPPPGVLSARLLGGGWADTPDDPSDEERALRAVEWQIALARRDAQLDRRRRMRDLAAETADDEVRARRDAERRQRAVRVELARSRGSAHAPRDLPTVDLAAVDITSLRIERL